MNNRLSKRFAIVFCLIIICVALYQVSESRTFQFFGLISARGSTTENIVALTFDDAPTVHSDEVLQVLQEQEVVATFYMIGQNIEKYPDQAKRIYERGHELGNHSYSHPRFLLKTVPFIAKEIETTNELIQKLGYTNEITFRPPYGKKLLLLPWYLDQKDIQTVMWDVEPDTYYPQDVDGMVNYTLENTQPGSIIILHPFCDEYCQPVREALPKIIRGLKERGYRFVTISDLLKQ